MKITETATAHPDKPTCKDDSHGVGKEVSNSEK